MSGHGVVAIDDERLDAFADALLRVADDLLVLRLDAHRLLDGVGTVPPGVDDLRTVSSRVRLLGLDTARRLSIIRNLPWERCPMPTSVWLRHPVEPAFEAVAVVREIEAHGWDMYTQDAAAFLDRLLAAIGDDEYAAAAALAALGVDGFRRLYGLAEREMGTLPTPEEEAAFLARCEGITAVLLAASRTVDHAGGLSRWFVDELFGAASPGRAEGSAPIDPADLAAVEDVLGATGAGQYLAAATQRAVQGGVGGVVTHAGRAVAIVGAAFGLIDAWDESPGAIAEAVATGALGVIGAFATGPVGWVATGIGVVIWMVTSAPEAGPPPPRTYPTDQENPGGAHYTHTVDGAGVPVAPNGV